MTRYLLDASVLIPLSDEAHEYHDRAHDWSSERHPIALCPTVEGALVRYLVRTGDSVATALEGLRGYHAAPNCEFWPDSLSYADAGLNHVHGYRQVTDAYLVSLAQANGGRLATLDHALASALPDFVTLVPG